MSDDDRDIDIESDDGEDSDSRLRHSNNTQYYSQMAAIPIMDICIICREPLSSDTVVTVTRGIDTLKSVSLTRGDDIHDVIGDLESITVHAECRRKYILLKDGSLFYKNFRPPKRDLPPFSPVSKKLRVRCKFDFRNLCFLCGKEASVEKQLKREKSRREVIMTVQTSSLKSNILKMIDDLPGNSVNAVHTRILSEDLQAVEARYHKKCYLNLWHSAKTSKRPRSTMSRSDIIARNMEKIYEYIEQNDNVQFTLAELAGVLGDNAPSAETIKTYLQKRYGCNMVRFTPKKGASTIVSFKDSDYNILKHCLDEKHCDVEEEKLNVLEKAATFIRNDIMEKIYETEFYPSADEFLEDVNASIPESLQFLLNNIILKNKRESLESYNIKCTSICHAIMSAVRPRSFLSPLQME